MVLICVRVHGTGATRAETQGCRSKIIPSWVAKPFPLLGHNLDLDLDIIAEYFKSLSTATDSHLAPFHSRNISTVAGPRKYEADFLPLEMEPNTPGEHFNSLEMPSKHGQRHVASGLNVWVMQEDNPNSYQCCEGRSLARGTGWVVREFVGPPRRYQDLCSR